MDLDDLKAEWVRRDQALLQNMKRQTRLMREMLTEKQLAKLRQVGGMSAFELIVWITFIVGFGAFLGRNFGDWKFFIPALLLDVWTITMGVITLRERAKLQGVDFSQPLLDIQRRLAALRIERMRTVQWAFLTGQALWWAPFVVVLFRGLFGVDLYTVSAFMPGVIAANIAISLALIPLAIWMSRGFEPRLLNSPLTRSFIDSITGRDLAEANALAGRIARFEQEAG